MHICTHMCFLAERLCSAVSLSSLLSNHSDRGGGGDYSSVPLTYQMSFLMCCYCHLRKHHCSRQSFILCCVAHNYTHNYAVAGHQRGGMLSFMLSQLYV